MKTGLILGKFVPLHKGHEHLLQEAINQVDLLFVAIYNRPDITNIPAFIRANWIKSKFPDVQIVICQNPHQFGPEHSKLHVKYIEKVFGKANITHLFSGETDHREAIAKSFGADLIIIPRTEIPVSGTEIRSNPKKYKNYLDLDILTEYNHWQNQPKENTL